MKSKVVILATGGTISGESQNKFSSLKYKAGSLMIDDLINAMPEIKHIANICGEQIANIDSANMNDEIWLKLFHRVSELVLDSSVSGVVITHGTDTLEESAYFLSLVVNAKKPVIFTGAMRPINAISTDSNRNLFNAIMLAISSKTKNLGVIVTMNDKIFKPRDVAKIHTLNIDAFASPNSGEIGYIVDDKILLNVFINDIQSKFNIKNIRKLPKVDIVYSYSNDGSMVAIEAFLKAGSKGIVVAGSGAGSIHQNQKKYLIKLLKENKIFVVKSSRVGAGEVILSDEEKNQGFINAHNLNPQKARILLMLALLQTKEISKIQWYFDNY